MTDNTYQNGVNFDFGFTATIYVLLGDGRRIVYWDTGLPPSFSRGFLTPLYGTTVGQSISAAGSTVFLSVLDSKNQLRFFTRMYDYEINGACPGLAYTYETKSCAADCDKTVPLGFGLRKLPLEGWREHSVAELQKGSVTAQVSIHLTGQGNSARELRIQGTQKGQTGYYFKGIDEGKWRFQVDARLAQSAQPSAPSMKNDPAPALLKDYEGEVLKAKSSGFQVKLKEFHPFLTAEEPSTIEISADGETQKIELHSVDGWTISSHAKHHEDLIGVHDGEPKSLQATIVLTPEQRNCVEFSPLCKILKENFAPYHEVVNNFQLAADDQSVYLRSNDGKLKFNFTRALTQADVDSSYYVKTARNVAKIEAPRGRKKIRELIQLHEATLKELKSLRKQYIQDDQKFALIDLFAVLALPSAKAIFSLDKTDPTYEKAVIDLKSPLRSEVRTEWVKLRDENRSLKVAENILKARMMELEVLAE
ncbi:MAG: hypothetical protein HYX41_00555 [Bdellovibrio sp.]|nr:hypothetical protein [Bdellovibrio sp.]